MLIDQFLKENGNNENEEENVQNGSEDEEQYVGEENDQDEDEVNVIEGKYFIIRNWLCFFIFMSSF